MYHDCFENRTNHACRFIAIYADLTLIDTSLQETIFILMNVLEGFTHIIVTFVVTLSIGTVKNCARFHPNIARIFLFFISHSYVYFSSRIVILLFQNGIFEIDGLGKISYTFLMIFSVLRVYHLYSCVFIFTAFCVERSLATINLEDYENRRNPTASIIILATVFLVSAGLGMDTTYADPVMSIPLKIILVTIVTFASGVASIVLHKHNLNHIKVMEKQIHRYKLSTRFQIVENCRAFELLRNVAIVATTGISLAAIGLVYCMYIITDPGWASVAGVIFDTLNAVVFASVIIICCFSQPFWRDEFRAKLRIPRHVIIHPFTSTESIRESYFADLTKSWESKQAWECQPQGRTRHTRDSPNYSSYRWTHSFTLISLAASLFCAVFIMLSGGSRFKDENTLHMIYLIYEIVCFFSFFLIILFIGYFGYITYSLQIEANQLRQQIYSKWLLDRAIALQKLNREVNEDEELVKAAKEKKKKQDDANPMHQKTIEEEEKYENVSG
ncbi:hypothetical protein PENTCL1PPCAC_18154, partial [Pristionchus entomophagus]